MIWWLILSLTAFAAPREKPSFVERQMLVEASGELGGWMKKFPKGTEIVAKAKPYYTLITPKRLADQEIIELRKTPGIQAITRDKELPLNSEGDPPSPQALDPNLKAAEARISYGCGGLRWERYTEPVDSPTLLAQYGIDGDLMSREMGRMGLIETQEKVAVIDTGFSRELRGQLVTPITWLPNPYSLKMDDERQHGTAVASVIGGAHGLGIAPGVKLASLRAGNGEKATAAFVVTRLLETCRDGYKIMNLSYGIDVDRDHPNLIKALAEEGCVVVNSAGNSYAEGHWFTDAEDSFFRVGGVDPASDRSLGFAEGEFYAPAVRVSVLSLNGRPAKFSRAFRLKRQAGTSFAAPLVTGILANVRAVLAETDAFKNLAGPDQVKLLSRILRASEVGGVVNGLRAVLIAEGWGRMEDPGLMKVDSFPKLIRAPSACLLPMPSCEGTLLQCERLESCFREYRYRLAACERPSNSDVRKMKERLVLAQEPELAAILARYLPEAKKERNALTEKMDENRQKYAELKKLRESTAELAEDYKKHVQDGLDPAYRYSLLSQFMRQRGPDYLKYLEAKLGETSGIYALFYLRQRSQLKKQIREFDENQQCVNQWIAGLQKVTGGDTSRQKFYDTLRQLARANPKCVAPGWFDATNDALDFARRGKSFDEYMAAAEESRAEIEKNRERVDTGFEYWGPQDE